MSLNKYVGIPFVSGGREYSGCDCWGLVRLYYKNELNIDLPSLNSEYTEHDTERMEELVAQYKEGWTKLEEPELGSLILFKVLGRETHVGIYIGSGKFLHSLEGNASAVQSVNSKEWQKRIVGYFKYSTGASLVALPHPLRKEKISTAVPEGTKLKDLSAWIGTQYNISQELQGSTLIFVNGQQIQDPEYVLKNTDTVEYRVVPGKSIARAILIVVAVFVIMQMPPLAGLTGAASAAATVAVQIGVTLLVDAIFPIRPPEQPADPGTAKAQYLLNSGSNAAAKYQSIPVVLGRLRMTPPLAANTYGTIVDNNDSYANMLVCWGYGPLDIQDLRIGGTPIQDLDTAEKDASGNPISSLQYKTYYGLDTELETDRQELLNFHGGDVEQHYANTKLTSDGTDAGSPWLEYTFNQEITKLSVAVNFPQGLRRLKVKGDGAGNVSETRFLGQIQYRPYGSVNWSNLFAYSKTTETKVPTLGVENYYLWYRVGINGTGIVIKKGFPTQNKDQEPNLQIIKQIAGKSYDPNNLTQYKAKPDFDTNTAPLFEFCVYRKKEWRSGGQSGGDRQVTINIIVQHAYIKDTNKFTYFGFTYTIPSQLLNLIGLGAALPISLTGGTVNYKDSSISSTDIDLGSTQSPGAQFVRRKDPFTWTSPEMSVPKGRYEVRVRRFNNSEQNPGGNEDFQNFHDAYLYTITGTAVPENGLVVNPPNTRLALTALKLKATENINGSLEGLNALVQTIALDYTLDENDLPVWKLQPTNNPASLFRYVLEHTAGAERVTSADQFDLSMLEHWHVFCAENGFEFNDLVTNQRSILEVLRDICAAGRASPTYTDGRWSVIIDEPRQYITQHFTPHNSWGFESVKALPKKPHAFRVKYMDETRGYQENELIVPNIGYTAQTAEIFEEIQFPGITKEEIARKHAQWHLAQLRLRPETYTLNTDMEYLVCNRGDLVRVAHDVPLWGTGTGRVKSVSGYTIYLDEPIALQPGTQYSIRVRTKTGTSVLLNLAGVTTLDYVDSVVSTTTFSGVSAGDLFIIGELNRESTELVVIGIEPFGDKNAKITLTDYSPDIYTLNFDSEYAPVFNTNITLPAKNLITSITQKPTIDPDTIRSDESVLTVLSPGVFQVNMSVPIVQEANVSETLKVLEVQVKPVEDNSASWPYKKTVEIGTSNLLFSDLTEGDSYLIRARYVTKDGKVGPWSDSITHTVVGKTNPPSTVAGLSYTILTQEGLAQVSWQTNPEPDIQYYEIRTQDTDWGLDGYLWRGNSTQVDLPLGPSGVTNTYYIRAVDYSKNYSLTSASLTVQIANPLPVTNLQFKYSTVEGTVTSNTNSSVTFTWAPAVKPVNGLEIKEYIINLSRPEGIPVEQAVVAGSTYTTRADWLGDAILTVSTKDVAGNTNGTAQLTVTKVRPGTLLNTYAEIVDNNVFLRWLLPEVTSLPISHVLIKRGTSWTSPDVIIGEKDGTFTSVIELAGGQYNYMLAAVDTDGRESNVVSIPATVSQPPDFIFNAEYSGSFTGPASTLANSIIETNTGNLLMLVDLTETWANHFTSRGWSTPQAQIAAGYPVYAQPGVGPASYTEIFDYGTILANSSITVGFTGYNVSGAPSVSASIQTSIDNVTWTTVSYSSSIFATNFRYVKISIIASKNAPGDLYMLQAVRLRLDSKQKTDAGKGEALSSDSLGTIVNFSTDKEFIDIVSITLTPNASTPIISVYDFKDTVLAGTYVLSSGVCTITVPNHGLETGQRARLDIISGQGVSGTYPITKISANSYSVSMNSISSSSGSLSTYPQSMRVYLFDNNGVRQNGSFGWALRGY
jgi:hypothetical protein